MDSDSRLLRHTNRHECHIIASFSLIFIILFFKENEVALPVKYPQLPAILIG